MTTPEPPTTPPTTPTTPPAVDTVAPGASGVYTAAQVHAWVKDPTAAPGKLLFLTFDDGPSNLITPKVLDALKAAQVHATFFIVGQEVPKAPEILKREVAEGNSIALHSLTHDYKKLYPGRSANAERVASEFDKTLAAVREVLGPDFSTTAWRYPGGHMSWKHMAAADAALEARGATWIDWNAMTGDAEPKKRRPTTVPAMVAMATQPITDGEQVVILLAHDSRGKDLTVASLPQIIDAYKAAGYGFGTLS
ncbi:polysaccharide deacetylase [Tessaracoccus antarcticus]|uniref:Polysaccharide deacetylase n=2 Tax=Tessaracoccus antarcticus TaxID=2479848 RepID=A0A3M0GAL7_9ACTN|nr:polysaccharide deacetylase [Tessaracoccus antarcticus]